MSVEKKMWRSSEVSKLISEFKSLPELWDSKSELYRSHQRNRSRKQRALEKLAHMFDTDIHEISRKLHNLRTQFHSEQRKLKAKQGIGDMSPSQWEYFKALGFIITSDRDVSLPACTATSTDNGVMSESYHSNEMSIKHEIIEIENAPPLLEEIPNKKPTFSEQHQCQQKLSSKTSQIIQKNQQHKTDDFQIFANYVAAELRGIRSLIIQRKLKLNIQKAIIEAVENDLQSSYYDSVSPPTFPRSPSVGSCNFNSGEDSAQ